MNCSIQSNRCNRTSEDLTFVLSLVNNTKIIVSSGHVKAVNRTAMLNYPNVRLHFNRSIIKCRFRGRTKDSECQTSAVKWLYVGCECFFSFSIFPLCFVIGLHAACCLSYGLERAHCFRLVWCTAIELLFMFCACFFVA